MKDTNFTQGLNYSGKSPERTPHCPDEYQLVTIAGAGMAIIDDEKLNAHLSTCEHCIERLADLIRIRGLDNGEPVPALLKARANRLGRATKIPFEAPRWAAAAVVVLAVGMVFNLATNRQQDPQVVSEINQPVIEVPHFRSIDKQIMRPEILVPVLGQTLPVNEPNFEWTAVQGSLYYDVRLVSAEGEMIWEERVKATSRKLPVQLQLQAGTDYYLRVDAYLAEAKRVSSRHVLFSTEERH
jgi:hypothetical protein